MVATFILFITFFLIMCRNNSIPIWHLSQPRIPHRPIKFLVPQQETIHVEPSLSRCVSIISMPEIAHHVICFHIRVIPLRNHSTFWLLHNFFLKVTSSPFFIASSPFFCLHPCIVPFISHQCFLYQFPRTERQEHPARGMLLLYHQCFFYTLYWFFLSSAAGSSYYAPQKGNTGKCYNSTRRRRHVCSGIPNLTESWSFHSANTTPIWRNWGRGRRAASEEHHISHPCNKQWPFPAGNKQPEQPSAPLHKHSAMFSPT